MQGGGVINGLTGSDSAVKKLLLEDLLIENLYSTSSGKNRRQGHHRPTGSFARKMQTYGLLTAARPYNKGNWRHSTKCHEASSSSGALPRHKCHEPIPIPSIVAT